MSNVEELHKKWAKIGAIMFGIDAGNEYRKYKKEKKYRLSKEQ